MNPDKTKFHVENPRLDSWKQIASYLGCEERTAKRWEGKRGLPVHRLPGVRSGVFAYIREIEAWQKQHAADQSASEAPFTGDASEADPGPKPAPPMFGRFPFKSPQIYVALCLLVAGLVGLPILLAHTGGVARSHSGTHAAVSGSVAAHVPSKDVEDIYLSGRYFWNKRTPADLESALGLFKQAVQRDPQYAAAYVGLADTYSLLVEYAALPPSEAYPPAIAAAQRAIALDPSLAEAHRSLGFSSFYWSWDRALSEQEFRKAIALDPRDAVSHHWLANTLMSSQRPEEALKEIEEARRLDPTAISIVTESARILLLSGHRQEGREALLKIANDDPSYLPVHWYLADDAYTSRDYPTYLNELKRVATLSHRDVDVEIYAAARKGFAAGGEKGLMDSLADEELSLFDRKEVPAFDVGAALAQAGRKKQAIEYLKLAYLNRDTQFLGIQAADALPMLKNDPEFQELAQKAGALYEEHAPVTELSRNEKMGPGRDARRPR